MKVYVPLTTDEQKRLLELAKRERRRPQDQAAVLIAQALGDQNEEEMKDEKVISAAGRMVA